MEHRNSTVPAHRREEPPSLTESWAFSFQCITDQHHACACAAGKERELLSWLSDNQQRMEDLVRDVVNIDSGTANSAGVSRVGAFCHRHPTRRLLVVRLCLCLTK